MAAPAWTRRSERGSLSLMQLMLRIARATGRRRARLLLGPIALYFWLFAPRERACSRRYLARVRGAEHVRPWSGLVHFHRFASVILDRVFLLDGRLDEFDLVVHGEHHLANAQALGRGAFLVGAHFGSFEAVRALGSRVPGRRVSLAMYEQNARKIGEFLRAIDPRLAEDVVPLGRIDSMLTLQARLQRGDFVGMLADRSIGDDATIPVQFLGASARFPTGVFRTAAVMRCPVLWMAGIYCGGNRYEIRIEPIADFSEVDRRARRSAVEAATREYAARLEHACRSAPYNWFNFYDFWDDR